MKNEPTPLKISFVLPVINETESLRQTVQSIMDDVRPEVCEILLVTARRTTASSLSVVASLKQRFPDLVRIHRQSLPYLGGALREAFEMTSGEYLMLMASDLETDPAMIAPMVEEMKTGAWDIVTTSRWREGGGFSGYGRIKLVLNYAFQGLLRVLYSTPLTDLTYAYRLYRTSILRGIHWQELKHPFLLESLIKPLRRGARVTELACQWRARREGSSAGSPFQTLAYLRPAIKVRLLPKRYFLERAL
jgi:glycosyltransferase involved in cell wall biosynthesis